MAADVWSGGYAPVQTTFLSISTVSEAIYVPEINQSKDGRDNVQRLFFRFAPVLTIHKAIMNIVLRRNKIRPDL